MNDEVEWRYNNTVNTFCEKALRVIAFAKLDLEDLSEFD